MASYHYAAGESLVMGTCIRHPVTTGGNDHPAGVDLVNVDTLTQGSTLYKQCPLSGLVSFTPWLPWFPVERLFRETFQEVPFAVEATASGTASMASFTLCSNSLLKSIALHFKMVIFASKSCPDGETTRIQHPGGARGICKV